MKRNAFGQITSAGFAPAFHRPFLRYFAPVEGAGQGGDGSGGGDGANGSGDGDGGNGGGDGGDADRRFTQEDVDRIVADRLARAARPKPGDQPKPKADSDKKDDEKPAGVSETDVDQRIQDALAAERKELALERVADQLDKALDGRAYAASKLFALDRSQFISEDGKSVDTEKLQKWVKDNTEEGTAPSRRLRAQGERDASASGGSIQSGRDLYHSDKPKKKD
ncbi:hypothetical protein [Microbacterium sp. NPDC080220]|uniref:hypothetical protein n=1 Tax=Microbacterium sp. NPDC080220 TaxID=3161017 RepID=UPI0034359EFA